MSLDLVTLLEPAHTAVVTSECQNGVIGAESVLPELAASAVESVIPNGARLCVAARSAGVPVVHCIAGRRPDDRGSNRNARLFGALQGEIDLAAATDNEVEAMAGELPAERRVLSPRDRA